MRFNRRRQACVLLVIFGAFVVSPACAEDSAAKIDEYVNALVNLHQFSGAVLVAREGKPLLSRGYRLADMEWGIANAPNTKFRIGSITKQFTALAIMMLQERGKLNVNDPICKYIPECPASWQPISIHELLIHSSGIADFTGFPEYKTMKMLPISPQSLVDSFKSKPLDFTPGAKFSYSNSGYEVLGLILEKASGQTYQNFLQENIFDPLGMKDTGYDSNTQVIARRASGYKRKGDSVVNADYIDMTVPYAAGGLYSTTQDLLAWDQALYTEKLVSRKSLDAIFSPHIAIVGYGWVIEFEFGHKMISHEGGIEGFVSKIMRFPDEHVTIIALSNLETAPITNLTRDLAAIVFGQKYELPHAVQFIHMDANQYRDYVGKYRVESLPDVVITITTQNDRLLCQVQDQSLIIFPESDTKFFTADQNFQIVFAKDEKGQVSGLVFNGQFNAKKLK